jgi:2-polyprenyl-6-hydroxyphenyl methylase/3-demethylubiquinone-9 3-methyltransferase
MKVDTFYKDHWTEYPLEIQGVLKHLHDLWPEGVKGKKILDGGSGSGVISVGLALLGADVTGVDITPQCVENGRKNAEQSGVQCRFLCKDLTDFDLGDDRFDIVYSWGVIHHSEDASRCFSNLAKHLKPGGEMILAVYLKTRLSWFWNFSRVFYQKTPKWFQAIFRTIGSWFLNSVDLIKKLIFGKSRYMMRGTNNKELINDWFGVPHRTFHSYDEVFQWFHENGLNYKLVNPATGRFKSTSNFVVRGKKE